MFEITKNIYVSSLEGCVKGSDELFVAHACKYPCYVSYNRSVPSFGNNGLYFTAENNLYMNIVDSSLPRFSFDLICKFLEFGSTAFGLERKLLIHCNEGKSRAPALAMLLMAKLGFLPDVSSYHAAYHEFIVMCPFYRPGTGIKHYLINNWSRLLK